MANILISYFSPVKEGEVYAPLCFFEALAKSFLEQGHCVKNLISSRFLVQAWNGPNLLFPDIDEEKLVEDIKAFAPDLCVFANNSVPKIVYEITKCPIILLLSDSVQFFCDKEMLKDEKHKDRIFYYAPFERDVREIEMFFGAKESNIIHALPATGVESEEIPVDKNVSFIGTNFKNEMGLRKVFKEFSNKDRMRDIIACVRREGSDLKSFLLPEERGLIEAYLPLSYFKHCFTPRNRVLVLALLAEEGLWLYGGDDWIEAADYFPDVAASFVPRKVYALRHNQDIYNSSKVCLSVSHTQAGEGFPWRVFDIMASKGCLLSDARKGIADFAKGYVDLPMFESPIEAKELTQKLLKDEAWRKEIVAGSQKCIAEKGRWKHRFPLMEEHVGVKLLGASGAFGTQSLILGEDYVRETRNPKAEAALVAEQAKQKRQTFKEKIARTLIRRLSKYV